LIQLVQGEIDRDIDHPRAMPEEPANDDFRSFIPSEQPDVFGAEEQVSVYSRTCAPASRPLSYWQGTPAQLRHLTIVALRVLGFLATPASVERAFSVARSVTGDYQMAMRQETVSARVMIRANWRIAQPLLADMLVMGRIGWNRAPRELEERKLVEDDPWRLGITEEMRIAHMPSHGET
jgi:hypothetical protein